MKQRNIRLAAFFTTTILLVGLGFILYPRLQRDKRNKEIDPSIIIKNNYVIKMAEKVKIPLLEDEIDVHIGYTKPDMLAASAQKTKFIHFLNELLKSPNNKLRTKILDSRAHDYVIDYTFKNNMDLNYRIVVFDTFILTPNDEYIIPDAKTELLLKKAIYDE